MRFTRRDLPGIAIALLGGPALMLLFLASFETWDHRGTPTLGFMGANLGLAVGFAAIFARFIRNWDWPIAFLALLLAAVAAVNWAQRSDNDGTTLATGLKWVAVAAFLLLTVSVGRQVLRNGLIPWYDRHAARRDERRAAEQNAEPQ